MEPRVCCSWLTVETAEQQMVKSANLENFFFFFKRGNVVCVFMSPTHLSGDSTRNDKILLTSLIKAVLYEL